MGKFEKAGSNKSFDVVSKKEAEKAQVIVIINIKNENLIDNPENGEDISFTEDLELSIKQNGFTDPIEVTDFGTEEGKYMIISGHRRRNAGVRVGLTTFPALVRHFKNIQEVRNYTLLSNSQRDSARDPFLFSKRYKMHENYLKESGFEGNKREEIAKRLGLSVQQADRYNMMNKIILPVWDLIRNEDVGMSSVQPLATHSENEQYEILQIMKSALKENINLTRDVMKKIIDDYRLEKKEWDPSKKEKSVNEDNEKKESLAKNIENKKQIKKEKDIMSAIHKLDSNLKEAFVCENQQKGNEMLSAIENLIGLLINQISGMSKEYSENEEFKERFHDIVLKIKKNIEKI